MKAAIGMLEAPIRETDDKNVSCIVCGHDNCELEVMFHGPGHTTWRGLHLRCWEAHQEYMRWWKVMDEEKNGT